jgi:hypothetical protein
MCRGGIVLAVAVVVATVTSELLGTSPVPIIIVPLSAAEASGQALAQSGGATQVPQVQTPV